MESPVFVKAFVAQVAIKSVSESPDTGDWLFHAPVALTGAKDMDGQNLSAVGIRKGLVLHERLGGHIDYAHGYLQSVSKGQANPKWLIGKRIASPDIDGVPNIVGKLFKSKPLAQEVWQHLQDGGAMGLSIEGLAKASAPGDRNHIVDTDIYLITVDPMPKGYEGTRIKMGVPSTLGEVQKSLSHEIASGDMRGWVALPADLPDVARPLPNAFGMPFSPVAFVSQLQKALTVEGAPAGVGTTGFAAATRENLKQRGAAPWGEEQVRCRRCDKKNRVSRSQCRLCGHDF